MRLRPLPQLVIALAAGILAALRLPPPFTVLIPATAAVLAFIVRPEQRRSALLLTASVALGVGLASYAANRNESDCRVQIPEGVELVASGLVTVEPVPRGSGMLRLEWIRRGRKGESRCNGEVRIRLRGQAAKAARRVGPPEVGSTLHAFGRWRSNPQDSKWPSRPEWAGTLIIDSLQVRSPPRPARHPLLTLRASAQKRFRALLPRDAALAEAMLLARKEGIDPEQRDQFARSGLAHLLAISGLHVGLIAGTLLLLGGVLRLSPRSTSIFAMATTIAYVLFLGAPHAAARAALQISLVLSGRLSQRPADPFSLIAAAAFIILVFDPLALIGPGFQLSFAGTGGIIALRRRFLELLPRWSIPRPVSESVVVSVAATLATAPITVMHFGQIAPIGIIANLVAIPITGVAVPALVLALLISYISMPAATFLAGGAELLLAALGLVADTAARVPGGQLLVPRDSLIGWSIAAVLAAIVSGHLARVSAEVRPFVRRIVTGGATLAILIAWPVAGRHLHDGRLEVHAIDVGQGDAFAIRTPRGHWILVDTGPGGFGFDAGRARVVPFLLRRGARRVDAMVLTHPDMDHIGGAGAVLDAFPVGLVVDPGVAVGKSLYRKLLHQAQIGRLRWVAARADLDLSIDGVSIQVLGIPEHELDETRNENQLSVAFRLEYGRFSALFLGDAPAELEEALVERYGEFMRADLLKVAHHGSTTSTAELLLQVARPRVAMISAGRGNRYGHPRPLVLERLERYEVQVLRTDLSGNITLRTGADGVIEIETER